MRQHIPIDLKPYRTRVFSLGEVVRILRDSGLAAKCPTLVVQPAGYALLPIRVKWFPVPFARKLNQWVDRKHPPRLRDFISTLTRKASSCNKSTAKSFI